MKKMLLYSIVALSFISCNNEEKKKEDVKNISEVVSTLPEMSVEHSEGDWGGDITLHIQKTEKISAELTKYQIASYYNGNSVGFYLLIKRPPKKTMFVANGVTLRSSGDTSNNFLKALADIYGIKLTNPVFTDSITVTYTDLTADVDLSKPGNWIAAQMKLFFETDEDTYELFLNIDEQAGNISLPEKDEGYRNGILTALSKKKK